MPTLRTVSPQHDATTRLAMLNCDESPTNPIAPLTDSYVVKNKPAAIYKIHCASKKLDPYDFLTQLD